MSIWKTLLLYFGLLFAAMIAACPHPEAIFVAWMFPLGSLLTFAGIKHGSSVVWPVIAYGIYGLFLAVFIAWRRRPWFYGVAVLYAVLLICNVAGCRQMVAEFRASQP